MRAAPARLASASQASGDQAAGTHGSGVRVFARAANVKKDTVGVSANVLIEIIADRFIVKELHLSAAAVCCGAGCWRIRGETWSDGGRGRREKGQPGTQRFIMPYITACVTGNCLGPPDDHKENL